MLFTFFTLEVFLLLPISALILLLSEESISFTGVSFAAEAVVNLVEGLEWGLQRVSTLRLSELAFRSVNYTLLLGVII